MRFPPRRAVLGGVVVTAAALTAGCGGSSDVADPGSAPPSSAPSTTAAPTTAPATAPATGSPDAVGPALRGKDLSGLRVRDLTSGGETTLEAALAAPNDTPVLAFFWAPY